MRLSLILAETRAHGIGKNNQLPWSLPKEFKYFVGKTKECPPNLQNAVIYGRRTWDSMQQKPMVGRLNILLSSSPEETRAKCNVPPSVPVLRSLEHALHFLASPDLALHKIFILGGVALYEEAMRHKSGFEIFLTVIDKEFECDVFWGGVDEHEYALDESYTKHEEENGVTYRLLRYQRRPPHPELAYLQLVREVMETGNRRGDRTGVGTVSRFGAQLRFDLSRGFPLLTTKKMFWKGVRDELLWFIAGDTDAKRLAAKGVHIWDGNGSRAALDARGLKDYPEGTLGPVYGFQWRHFGAEYKGADADYTGKGVDQLADVIRLIRTDPNNRRIILSAWNPADLNKMVLPPCHVLCQFYVADGKLSSHLYQRSADLGLGVPFK